MIPSSQFRKMELKAFFVILAAFLFVGCASHRDFFSKDINPIVRAATKLGVDIDENDNHNLFIVCADWLNTPYRLGGKDKSGVDCSGFTQAVYRKVFGIELSPISNDQYTLDVALINPKNLKPGDLVFFSDLTNQTHCNHVGIYLKNGKFIHASTSSGVIVSNINEGYWSKRWIGSGTIPK